MQTSFICFTVLLQAFYASKLSEVFYERHAAMPIMLNPCHNPVASLDSHKGMNTNFVTGESFEFTEQAIASYRDMPFPGAKRESCYAMQVLPYRLQYYPKRAQPF